MKANELANILNGLPDKEVYLFWDGAARGEIEGIMTQGETVVIVGDWSIYRDRYKEEQIVYG